MMSLDPNAQPEAERDELERVVEALARWPRLSHLLQYIGEKFFSGDVDQLNEYNIATEVLGRSKTLFNAGEDAIARVETHRLRKRLAEFYETEGRDHPIQVTLPTGSYVPVFIHKLAVEPQPASPDAAQTSEPKTRDQGGKLSRWIVAGWKYWAFAAILLIVSSGFYVYVHTGRSSAHSIPGGNQAAASVSVPLQPEASSSAVRILAGYSGPPRTDSAGRVWNPDRYFSGGGSWQRAPGFIARTSTPFLFDHSRTGDFSYRIPLTPGSYEVHLFFSTHDRSSDALSTFNVWIDGEWILRGFDINSDALGEDIADERIFRGVSPDKDGFLQITFAGGAGTPTLNAIEILPSVHSAQLPIRLIMQTTPLTDHKGQFWSPDDYFMNGRLSDQTHPLPDSPDPDLFSGERYGHFTYAIPVDTRDSYTLVLHFAEFYFGSGAPGGGGAGSRLFKVMCNGETLLNAFDIVKEAGNLHEVAKAFHHLKPSAQGKLNLTFEPMVNNATVSGIEVLDESE
jgi:Malectin domain